MIGNTTAAVLLPFVTSATYYMTASTTKICDPKAAAIYSFSKDVLYSALDVGGNQVKSLAADDWNKYIKEAGRITVCTLASSLYVRSLGYRFNMLHALPLTLRVTLLEGILHNGLYSMYPMAALMALRPVR